MKVLFKVVNTGCLIGHEPIVSVEMACLPLVGTTIFFNQFSSDEGFNLLPNKKQKEIEDVEEFIDKVSEAISPDDGLSVLEYRVKSIEFVSEDFMRPVVKVDAIW